MTDLAVLLRRFSNVRVARLLSMVITETVLRSLTMPHAYRHACLSCLAAAALCLNGCTSLSDYVHHGFKVGPEYCPATAEVAPQWIDAADIRVRSHAADLSRWWCVFNDPTLNDLVCHAYNQNINLKEYGTRILQARYNLAIKRAKSFPQTQTLAGGYSRQQVSTAAIPITIPGFVQSYDNVNLGFNLQWELDFWGLYRRQVLAAKAQLEGSVENYDAVLVTLLGDVAQYYVTMRETQERIELARQNTKLQRNVLKIVQARFDAGSVSALDVAQQQTVVSQTESTIPALEITLRQAQDQLCTLLGIPPADLQAHLGQRPIPTVPGEVAVGIPAQLLERRPDIRSAERNAAAQAQQIGIAQAELYPHISITGTLATPTALGATPQNGSATLGYSAQNLSQLFTPGAFTGSVGPSFQWNILNYGRLANNVRLQDAKFQQSLLDYRTAVLTANQEAEDGLIAFLRSQTQAKLLAQSVLAANKAYQIGITQYREGTVDFTRLAQLQETLQQQEDSRPRPAVRSRWAWFRSIGRWVAAGRSGLAKGRQPDCHSSTPLLAGRQITSAFGMFDATGLRSVDLIRPRWGKPSGDGRESSE